MLFPLQLWTLSCPDNNKVDSVSGVQSQPLVARDPTAFSRVVFVPTAYFELGEHSFRIDPVFKEAWTQISVDGQEEDIFF